MTKADFVALQSQVRILALDIGLRPAARAVGLKETRVLKWAERGKWGISVHHPVAFPKPTVSSAVISAVEAKQRLLAQYGERTRFGLAIAGTKASEHLADLEAHKLVAPAHSIAADQWSRVGDRVHGWSAERAKGTQVQVAIVPLPTEAERAERREMHDKLDAIAAKLREHPIP